MIIIARSPGNRSLNQVRYHIATTVQDQRVKEKAPKTWCISPPFITEELQGHVLCFFFILDDEIPEFTCVKFEKKTDIKLRND